MSTSESQKNCVNREKFACPPQAAPQHLFLVATGAAQHATVLRTLNESLGPPTNKTLRVVDPPSPPQPCNIAMSWPRESYQTQWGHPPAGSSSCGMCNASRPSYQQPSQQQQYSSPPNGGYSSGPAPSCAPPVGTGLTRLKERRGKSSKCVRWGWVNPGPMEVQCSLCRGVLPGPEGSWRGVYGIVRLATSRFFLRHFLVCFVLFFSPAES